jgi:hypothetical protein
MNKYKDLKINGKSEREHRVIMEKYIGRKLSFDECVHHKNGDRSDNRIKNLEIMSRSEHSKKHRKLPKRINVRCNFCNKKRKVREKYYSKNPTKTFYCSMKCLHLFQRKVKDRPSINKLKKLVMEKGFVGTGKMYNVSDNAIRKWMGLKK